MQYYALQRYYAEKYRILTIPPKKTSSHRRPNIFDNLVHVLKQLFTKKVTRVNKPQIIPYHRSERIKPLLFYHFERPELCVLKCIKSKNVEFYLTKTKIRQKFEKTARRCFKGSLKVEFLHESIRPTYLSVKDLPIKNLTKIHWVFIRRHSMTNPILEKQFVQIVKTLKKATKLKDLTLEFSGGHDIGKPNYTTTFVKFPMLLFMNHLKPLTNLTLYFKRSSGIVFSADALQQLMELISIMPSLENLSLEIVLNPNETRTNFDQSIFSKSISLLRKLKILRLLIHNVSLAPAQYCQLWDTIKNLKLLQFVLIDFSAQDLTSFESFKQAVLTLPEIKQLYLTSNEVTSVEPIHFSELMNTLKTKPLQKIILNLDELAWFNKASLESIRDLFMIRTSRVIDLNFSSLAINESALDSVAQSIKQNKSLRSFGMSFVDCNVKTPIIAKVINSLKHLRGSLTELDVILPGLDKSQRVSIILDGLVSFNNLNELKLDLSSCRREDAQWLKDLKRVLDNLPKLKVLLLDFSKSLFTQNFMVYLGEAFENLGNLVTFTLELEQEDSEPKSNLNYSDNLLCILITKLGYLRNIRDLILNLKGWEGNLAFDSILMVNTIRHLKYLKKLCILVSFMFNGGALTKFISLIERSLPKVSLFLTDRV